MPVLGFTLSPESLGKLHDALVCLGKFSEAVCIEAAHDKVFGHLTQKACNLIGDPAHSNGFEFLKIGIRIVYSDREEVLH